ncbi:hypothetical protein RCH21_003343 [Arthrobacter sp. PL16]|uniref:hypothetical protein n=1 Tax=Arthrobacter sp. PL16 TaxID=3071720 RepID=UPI002E0017D1|nr:hypothetical protein [Arthrobacter sp. PL16]
MLVYKVDVKEADGGFIVTCPDVPALRHLVQSPWEACSVRHLLAEHARVPDDLVWLHIRTSTGAMTIISDVHPLHWISFHTINRPSHPAFDPSKLLFEHAAIALQHEADHATLQDRSHAQVTFILSMLDGTKVSLPRAGGYHLEDVLAHTRVTGDLGAWIRTKVQELPASTPHWHSPILGIQTGIFRPESSSARRYR